MRKSTKGAEETKKIAADIARKILRRGPGKKTAAVFGLRGGLGSGKTTFVQGFFKGLGIKSRAVSPTFIIFRRHRIPGVKSYKPGVVGYKFVYHMDAYRLKSGKDTGPLGLKKLFKNPENIFLIEWAENIKSVLPKKSAWIKFYHGKKEKERILLF